MQITEPETGGRLFERGDAASRAEALSRVLEALAIFASLYRTIPNAFQPNLGIAGRVLRTAAVLWVWMPRLK